MTVCNTTLDDLRVGNEENLSIGITFHRLGLILSAAFGLLSVVIASYLIMQHATHYSKPWEQKHIIRVLFMIPIYSIVSFVSYLDYPHAIYWQTLRDCYEAFAIASFFTLLCNYILPKLHDQKDFFRASKPKNWIWPVPWLQNCTGGPEKGWLRKPQSGLTWFNVVWLGIFQYCFIRVVFSIVSAISQHFGRYCDSSLSPEFAHIWVMVLEGTGVLIAMYMLIQFYYQLREELAEHKPFLKLACIKLVIFFSFWQNLIISFLSSSTLKPTAHMSYPDIKVGLPSLLLCIEMAIFAVLHLFAFPWRRDYAIAADGSTNSFYSDPLYTSGPDSEYAGKPRYHGGFLGWRALASAFNPWDFVKASARAFRWLFVGRRHRHEDPSYRMPLPGGKTDNVAFGTTQERIGLEPTDTHLRPLTPAGDSTNDLGLGAGIGPAPEDTEYHGAYREFDSGVYRGAPSFDPDTTDKAGLVEHAVPPSTQHPALREDHNSSHESDTEGEEPWNMPAPRGGWV